ncbi:MAG TPA: hypothetical protein DDW83_06005 [Peptococcaceae bacterium]|jgi:anthranilate synthase component 1|nr:hypothetical protein [Peptococcaceae bacterium]
MKGVKQMIRPDSGSIQALAQDYSMIPVCREIYADAITPITLLRKLAGISKRYFLLESVEGGEKWGRYSFLGFDPVMRVYGKEQTVTIEQDGAIKRLHTKQPYDLLREIQQTHQAPRIPGLPPFTGGFVGYWAYAMLGYAEPKLAIKRGFYNDFDLMLFDKVIAYDHLKQKIYIVVNMKTDRVLENYGKAMAELEAQPRGIYGGALGYVDFTGNMDTCIAIRMAAKKDNQVYVQAGSGIVADSIPEKEYEESENKALAVINAICHAKEVDDF